MNRRPDCIALFIIIAVYHFHYLAGCALENNPGSVRHTVEGKANIMEIPIVDCKAEKFGDFLFVFSGYVEYNAAFVLAAAVVHQKSVDKSVPF